MYNPIRIHRVSFKHAYDGIVHNIKTQPNFRFHIFATVLAISLGIFLHLNTFEWIVLVFTFNMVMVAEMLNTSIEAIVDLITVEKRQDAKVAKDVSSGMVLIAAILSVIIGLVIFGPKILNLLNS